MPLNDHRIRRDAEWTGPDKEEQDMFVQIIDQIARLREENDDLRGRVRRLEARSGRGIMHPSEFSDGMTPRTA